MVNADESEPGTAKDREILLRNPHAMLEGILIMSWAIKAAQAFIYIRGEYLTEYEVLRAALAQARERGFVDGDLFGTGYRPNIVLHRGAGAYICGEEMALLSSLNGYRGQPSAKPPFPAVSGAFQKPTLLNNVETHATIPYILRMGADGLRQGRLGAVEGHPRPLALGARQAPGQLRAPVHRHARRPDRGSRRRRARRQEAQGDHPGRLLGAVPRPGRPQGRPGDRGRWPPPARWPARAP